MTSPEPAPAAIWQAYAQVVALADDLRAAWAVDLTTALAGALVVAAIPLLLAGRAAVLSGSPGRGHARRR